MGQKNYLEYKDAEDRLNNAQFTCMNANLQYTLNWLELQNILNIE